MTTELLLNVQGGARICVPANFRNITTFVLLEQETWFEDELGFARACVGRGQNAADVGANLGVFTTALAASVGEQGRVLAFEPTASTAALLRRTLDQTGCGQVRLVQAALSERRGQALLEIGASPELNALTESPAAGRATERVELLTLDEVLREQDIDQLAFLKIDAEGHELPVARGADHTLKQLEPLVMFEIAHGGAFDFRLLDHLEGLGFGAYRLVPGLGVLMPFTRDEPVDAYQLNLFACTPERARLLAGQDLLIAGELPVATLEPRASADVEEYLQALPGGREQPPGDYGRALAHVAAVETSALRPAEELAHVLHAHRLAGAALQESASIGRTLTFARLCADLGQRSAAVNALVGLVDRVQEALQLPLEEPCLPPVRQYASLDPGADPTAWLQCAVVEGYVRLSAFSSFFQGAESLPALEYLQARPYFCAEMERRRQLLRMSAGMQQRPEPHPLLAQQAADNLNPRFWTGAS